MAEPSTVARPYAEAVFKLADAAGALPKWGEMLAALGQVAADPAVRAAIADPKRSEAQAAGLFISVLGGGGDVTSSLVAHGGRIDGTVRRSILFPGVQVDAGAVVEDSIVMHDTWIARGARIEQTIVDKQVRIGEGAEVGVGTPARRPDTLGDLESGLSVIGKRAEIPARARIGRNAMIESGVREADFESTELAAGSTVRPRERRRR